MTKDVLVVAEHAGGALDDITFEMLGQARKLAESWGGRTVVALVGGDDPMAAELGAADQVVAVGPGELSDFNPESHAAAVQAVVDARSPRLTMVGYTAKGMDLANAVATRSGVPHASFCTAVRSDGDSMHATGQLYGGKMNVTSDLGAGPAVVSMLAGSAPADAGRTGGEPEVETLPAPATAGRIRFKRLIEPEAGDVDITAKDVLVAVGRGIGSKDDIEVAEELAEELDAAVAASRPLIDAGWLPKTRQVGKSGLKVSPKLYLALGISGAPEHLEGMKGATTIVAVNTDKSAPIFGVAHYGLAADLFEVCEELTEAVRERKG